MPDPPSDEQAAQQDQLVKGAAAKTLNSPDQGAESVGADGSFSYTIPIRVPAGVRGMQPNLSVAYNSRVGNGLLGLGWTLKGIPEIHRISGGRGLNFDGDDHYAVNFSGWGTPDDPGLRLVYVGTDPRPRGARPNPAVSALLLDLTRYVLAKVWKLDWPVDALMSAAANSSTQWEPVRIRGNDVPSIDVTAFLTDHNAEAPQPAPISPQVFSTWNFNVQAFSWPCEATAVRCWLRVLKINPLDWPLLGIEVFNPNDIYHTANETWGEYHAKGFCGDGPCYWVLRDGKGNTYYFGGDDNYHAQAPDGSGDYPVIPERFNGDRGNRGILMWSLYEVVDRYGNGYKISYHSVGSSATTLVPKRIDYLQTGGASIQKAVTFTYQSRSDIAPMPAYFDLALHTIGIELSGQQQRQYVLTYETGASQRSRLATVQELGPDGQASNGLPPYRIAWRDAPALTPDQLVHTTPFYVLPAAAPLVADFNGDGFSDVAFVTQDYHGISRQFAFGSSAGLGDTLINGDDSWDRNASPPDSFKGGWAFAAGDVTGDGKADLVRVQLGPDQIAFSVGVGGAGIPWNFDQPRSVPWPGDAESNDWGNWQVICADINNDRIFDVVVVHPGAPTIVYALGSRQGLLDPIVLSSSVEKLPQWAVILVWSGGPPPANAAVLSRMSAGDINGDGYLDLLASVTTLWGNESWDPTPQISYIMGSETGLRSPMHWTALPGQAQFVTPVLADINGDNRADLVLNSRQIFYGRSDVDAPLRMAPDYDPTKIGVVSWPGGIGDANGDGIADSIGGALGNPTGRMYDLPSFDFRLGYYTGPFFADLNGDGLQDVIQLPSGDITTSGVDLVVELADARGPLGQAQTLAHLDNLGGDFANVVGSYSIHDPPVNPSKYAHAVTGDFNGDGVQDILLFPYYLYSPNLDLHGPTTTKPPYRQPLPLWLSRTQQADQLASVTNTLGGKVTVTYQPAPQVAGAIDSSNCGSSCERSNLSPRLLVTRVERDPRTGPVRSIAYSYKNGRVRSGGVFEDNDLGFDEVDALDEQTHLRQQLKYYQTPPLQRRLVESDSIDAAGKLLSSVTYSYDYVTPYLGVNFVRLLSKTTNSYEANTLTSTATTTYTYDAYGAATSDSRVIDKKTVRTQRQYTHNPNQWLLGRVDATKTIARALFVGPHGYLPDAIGLWERNTFAPNGVELAERERLLCDDANSCTCPRNQDCTPVMPGGGQARWVPVEQGDTYDVQGNLQYSADPYGHGVTYGHDPNWGAVTSVSRTVTRVDGGQLTLTTQKHYDSLGRVDSETDENGVNTAYHYDSFDRVRRIDRPSGAHEFYDFVNWGDPSSQTFVKTIGPYGDSAASNTTLGEVITQYVDGFGTIGREDMTAGEGQTITRWRFETFSSGRRYVAYNRPAFLTVNRFPPTSDANEWLGVSFDDADRPSVITSWPSNKGVEWFSYAPLKVTVSDQHQRSLTTTFDTRGRVSSKSDAYGTWFYTYDDFDRPSAVDMPDGSELGYSYDNWGRRRGVYDPALGEITVTPDDVGNVMNSSDANGTVSYAYDEIGRVRTKTDSTGTISYTYDRPETASSRSFTIGRLSDVSDHAGTISLKYDAAGRITERTRTIAGRAQPIVVDYTYDFLGRLQAKVLGDTALTFSYPDGRNLREVFVNGQSFAKLSQFDARRQPGVVQTSAATRKTWRDSRGGLRDLLTQSTSGVVLQQLHVDSDLLGNPLSITDQRATPIEGSVDTNETVSFGYDGDNRLGSIDGPKPIMQELYNYDPQGNFTKKGSLTFVTNDKQITAQDNTGAIIATETFDAVGNLATRDDAQGHWNYDYDNDHKLTGVKLNNALRLSAYYDYTGTRVKKVFTRPGGSTVTTYYVDGLEIREDSSSPGTTSTTIHVAAPQAGMIASITTGRIAGQPDLPSQLPFATSPWGGDTLSGPAEGIVFYHSDALSNPSLITDTSGNVVSHSVYKPYGNIVTEKSVGRDVATPKFTGKEGDEETGFVYFGARYYDPLFGRFITPDSVIPGGGTAPQGFNRYAYAFDNPVRFTDPDGHNPVAAFWGAVIGGGLGLGFGVVVETYNWATTDNDFNYRAVLADTAGGAVTGGLIGLSSGLALDKAVAAGWAASSAIAGGIANRTIQGKVTTADDVMFDATVGVVTYGMAEASPAIAGWLNNTVDDLLYPVPMLNPKVTTGPVVFTPPPGASPAEVAQVQAYCQGCNDALNAGALSPTGRVSTQGQLRAASSRAAAQERAAAAARGTPYSGQAGHVPDTTWTGNPQPFSWMDLSPLVNTSLGGQAGGYPIGYQPTEFIFSP